MIIFLDESGQFSKHNNEQYFVIASFTVGNPRRTEKAFRSWRASRFPRKMRKQSEIKWSSKIDSALRLKTLHYIARLDVRIRYSYLLHKNIPINYWRKNKLQSGSLYLNVVGETLDMYLPTDDKEFRVFCDQRRLKDLKRSKFKTLLANRLLAQMPKDSIIQIEMIDSTTNANIQISDWIAGALAWYLEKKPLGEECFRILQNNILGKRRELFSGI